MYRHVSGCFFLITVSIPSKIDSICRADISIVNYNVYSRYADAAIAIDKYNAAALVNKGKSG